MIMYTGKKKTIDAVQGLRLAFPAIPIYARAQDLMHLLDLKKAGVTDAILETAETSLQLGSKLLKNLGVMSDDVDFLSQLVRSSMELQAQDAIIKSEDRDTDVMKPMQVRVANPLVPEEVPIRPAAPEEDLLRIKQLALTQVMRSQDNRKATNGAARDSNQQQLDDLQGKGVFYCELSTQDGDDLQSVEAVAEEN